MSERQADNSKNGARPFWTWPRAFLATLASSASIVAVALFGSSSEPEQQQAKITNLNDASLSGSASPKPTPSVTTTTPIKESFIPAAGINDAIQEALEQSNTVVVENTPLEFDDFGVEGLRQDENGQIFYHDWTVSDEIYRANIETAEFSTLPLSYLYAVQSAESSFNADVLNDKKACGLTQFMPKTLSFLAFNYADDIGFSGIEDFVESHNVAAKGAKPVYKHSYIDATAQHSLVHLCFNETFNTRLGIVNKLRDIGRIQKNLKAYAPEGMDYFPVTQLQGYVAVFAGGGGGQKLLLDLLKNKGTSLVTNEEFFTAAAVKSKINQRLMFHTKVALDNDGNVILEKDGTEKRIPDTENPRTVAEFYQNISEIRGIPDTPLPDVRNWRKIIKEMAARIAAAEPPRAIERRLDPAFISQRPPERPLARPGGPASALAEAANNSAVTVSLRPEMRPNRVIATYSPPKNDS